jgi:N-acetylglucosaminyl-diphospho-decaprenol L-rhamnosyltransferase
MILILNPDMVPLPGSIGAMVQHLEEDATLGAVGGYCIDPEGRFEHRYAHTLPTPRTAYLETFGGRGKVRNRAYRRHALLDADFSKPVEVPQPAGGCLMLRRSVFANALADERFGIYWSDVSIARQVHDAGFRAKVFPDAVFLHDHAATAPNPAVGAKLKTDYYVGAIRYFRIHGSAGQARLAKLLFAWGIGVSTIRAIAEVLLRLHPRQHLRRQVRVLADFLRDRSPFADRQ